MICPTCGAYVADDETICNVCCHPIDPPAPSEEPMPEWEPETPPVQEEAPESAEAEPEMPKKKVRRWPAFLFLGIIFIVGLSVFLLTQGMSSVSTDPDMPWFSAEDGVLYFDEAAYDGPEILTVPSSVGGQKITALSDACFANTKKITGIELPDTLRKIGNAAFAGSELLRGVFIPEGVSVIGERAFYGCMSLESVCIPSTVQQIGRDAFTRCMKLHHIFYNGKADVWKSLYLQTITPKTRVYTVNGVV